MFAPLNSYPNISFVPFVPFVPSRLRKELMQFKQLQINFRRSMSENKPVLYNQNLSSYHGSKENTRNANRIIPKITSSRSATIHIKQLNKIRMKAESSTEEKLKEAINQKERQIEEKNLKIKEYQNEYDQLRKQLKEAKLTNNHKKEEYCMTDIHYLVKFVEMLGKSRSELRAERNRLQKELKQLKDEQI